MKRFILIFVIIVTIPSCSKKENPTQPAPDGGYTQTFLVNNNGDCARARPCDEYQAQQFCMGIGYDKQLEWTFVTYDCNGKRGCWLQYVT